MAGKDVDEIRIAGTGKIFVAPVGTVAPTDVATAWAAGWIDLGFTSEDGVTFRKDRSTGEVMVWQQFFAARRFVESESVEYSFSLAQWNEDTVKLAFGGGTVTTTAGPPAHYLYTPPTAGTLDERAVGIELVDGDVTYRIISPRTMLTEGVETQFIRTGMAELPLTLGVIGDDTVAPFLIRTNDPAWAA